MLNPNITCGQCGKDSGISCNLCIVVTSPLLCRNCGAVVVSPSPIVWSETNTLQRSWHNRNYRQTKFVEQIPKIRGEE